MEVNGDLLFEEDIMEEEDSIHSHERDWVDKAMSI
jgi:hypothetical protein